MGDPRSDVQPSAWLVRGGQDGEREQRALEEGLAIIGWHELGDLSVFPTRESLRTAVDTTYPEASRIVGNWTTQLWTFVRDIQEGDLIVMPLKTSPGHIAIGRCIGPYEFRQDETRDFRQIRKVEWLNRDVHREAARPDLRASMGSLLTVCRLSRNEAPRRIESLARNGIDPGVAGESEATDFADLLEDAATRTAENPQRLTIRRFLDHWGVLRRTAIAVERIKSDLATAGLTTRPPFTDGAVEDEIELVPLGEPGATSNDDLQQTEDIEDPQPMTLRLGSLPAQLIAVPRTASLTAAKTMMIRNDFSQLAVIDENQTFYGAVSWESIGRAHVYSRTPTVTDALAPAVVIDHDAPLLDQIETIYAKGFVFVRSADHTRVTGIITAADLTRQFGNHVRPFALIEEAENRLRRASTIFTVEELRESVANHQKPKVFDVTDLTFGNYFYLLKDGSRWERLAWDIDHDMFLGLLKDVGKVRNEIMHFAPDSISEHQYAAVHGLLNLLRTVDPAP